MIDKSEKFSWAVRLGFAARGLVYILVGYLALTATRSTEGAEGAFDLLQDKPLGTPILYLAAVGLFAYGLFRLASLVFDVENKGTSKKGIAERIGHGASGLVHLVLAWTAFKFANGAEQTASDTGTQEAAGTLLSFSFGSLALGVIGLGLLAAAVFQAKGALSANFTRHLAGAPPIVTTLGRIGYAARAVVFLIMGWSLVRSAWFGTTGEIKSLGDAVRSLADDGTMYTLVAAGLLIFGVFSLLLARYRIVPDIDSSDLRPSLH
jgi:hypothetical protein